MFSGKPDTLFFGCSHFFEDELTLSKTIFDHFKTISQQTGKQEKAGLHLHKPT